MQITILPSATSGEIKAIASKSVAHRLLICAAFADRPSSIECKETNDDITATVECLCAMGASIKRVNGSYEIEPIKKINKGALLPCNESGSTLRFLVPICAALGGEFTFDMKGRLPQRPLSPLKELLEDSGITFKNPSPTQLTVSGQLSGNYFEIAGDVSSQFITGLLFALTLTKKRAALKVTKTLESAPYINITLDALSLFGANIKRDGNTFNITNTPSLSAPKDLCVEGDWSNAAFPLALGIIGKGPIKISGLSTKSSQGDKEIVNVLRAFGGSIEEENGTLTAEPSALHGIEVDASQIPDLVPIIATVATVADGRTTIYNASRLKLKESDRLQSTTEVLSALGACISQTDDGLIIKGRESLKGGSVSSFGDHRIAMSAAVASAVCTDAVTLCKAESTQKSYPTFWEDMRTLGLNFQEN